MSRSLAESDTFVGGAETPTMGGKLSTVVYGKYKKFASDFLQQCLSIAEISGFVRVDF